MSETPALQLEIRDNAAEVAKSLGKLDSVLRRVQSAAENASGYSKVADGMKQLMSALSASISEESVARMERMASAVERLSQIGAINIKVGGAASAGKASPVADIAKAAQTEMQSATEVMQSATREMQSHIEEAAQEQATVLQGAMEPINSATREMKSQVEAAAQEEIAANQSVARSAAEIADQYINATSKVELLQMRIDALKAQLIEGIENNTFDDKKIADYALRIQELQHMQSKAAQSAREHAEATRECGNAARRSSGAIGKLAHSFGRILMYRAIRTVIREITEGFKFGLANVREYSKVVGTDFYRAMDTANNATFKMKNSLGAGLAPILQALVPLLQTVTNWVIQAANAVNQFVSLLGGATSWTRATDAAADTLDNVKDKAKGASGAMKNLLADWDELNIIQSQGGGGAGGGLLSEEDAYASMFEQVYDFEGWIRDIVGFIRENADQLIEDIKWIGAAILAWKVGSAFGGVLSTIGALVATGAIVKITWDMVSMLDNKYLDTKEEGWLVGDLLVSAVGATLAGRLTSQVLGKGWGATAATVLLMVSALSTIKATLGRADVSALSEENVITAITASLKLGAGVGLSVYKFGKHASPAGRIFNTVKATAGAALVTFGATIGIKAIKAIAETGNITMEDIKSLAVDSLSTGLGVGLLASAFGAAAGTAALAGIIAGGAVAVVGALVGLALWLAGPDEGGVQWGDVTLTQNQVRDFVETQMLDLSPIGASATIELLDNTLAMSEQEKANLTAQVTALLPDINTLKLGVDQTTSLTNIKKEIFGESMDGEGGVIGAFKAYAETKKTQVKTLISLAPMLDNNGEDISKSFLSSSIEGWDALTGAMEKLGADLNEHLEKSLQEGLEPAIRQYSIDAVSKITEVMATVSSVIAQSQLTIDAELDLQVKLDELSLQDFSEETFRDVLGSYQEYQKKIRDKMIDNQKAVTSSEYNKYETFTLLAGAYEEFGDQEMAEYYRDQAEKALTAYESARDYLENGIQQKITESTAPGQEMILSFIQSALADAGFDPFTNVLTSMATAKLSLDANNGLLDDAQLKEAAGGIMQEFVESVFGINVADYGLDPKALADLILSTETFRDILSEAQENAEEAAENTGPFGIDWDDMWAAVEQEAEQYEQQNRGLFGITIPVEPEFVTDQDTWGVVLTQDIEPQIDPKDMFDIENILQKAGLQDGWAIESYLQHIGVDNASEVAANIYEYLRQALMAYPDYEGADWVEDFMERFGEYLADPDFEDVFTPDQWEQFYTDFESIVLNINRLLNSDSSAMNDNAFSTGILHTAENVENGVARMRAAIATLDGLGFGFMGGLFGGTFRVTMPGGTMATANGTAMNGNAGEMVSHGQAMMSAENSLMASEGEQTALLREQNSLLTQLLHKEFTARAVPSSEWGGFIAKSSKMYTRNTGVSVG